MRGCVRRVAMRSLAAALLAWLPLQSHAQVRIVEDVVASEQRGYVSVTVLFGCSLRYVSHTPASEGDTVQVRFSAGADCGSPSMSEPSPLLAGAAGVVRSMDVVRPFGSDVELRIGWARAEAFVLVPAFDGRGLRIRLLRPETPNVTVRELPAGTSTYAVNLDSSLQPYTPDALAAAAKVVNVRTYQSELVVDDQRWYRLRAGPFVTEADAKVALANARAAYPKAWIAISDDVPTTEVGTPAAVTGVAATVMSPNATLTADDRARTLAAARTAFRRKDYAAAIPLLTQLTAQPEFAQRAEAQELLGLARERTGQVAHAKAEYEEYLRRYPDGAGAARVRKRLQALAWAARPGRATGGALADESAWRVYGGLSQVYRQDQTHVQTGSVSNDATTQNALLNDVAFVARRRGERFDFTARTSAGYTYDMLANGPGSEARVSLMFAELTDRTLNWSARFGRQSGNVGGVLGTFDGLVAGYQLWPHLRVNGFFGFPVDASRSAPQTDRRFVGLSTDLGTFASAWDLSLYAIEQQYAGVTDRQALGTEVRYFKPGVTVVGLLDYDVHYQALNNVLLLGTFALPARWTLNLNVDQRRSPVVTTRNAMIGQSVQRFDQLFGLYTQAEIEQLALDRSPEARSLSLGVSRPLGDRWQWSLDASTMTLGSTPASGGVAATPSSGSQNAISTQAMGYGLFGRGDVNTIGLQYQTSATVDMLSLGLGTQLPVGATWRIGPRLRIDQRDLHTDGSTQRVYSPSLRAERRNSHLALDLEAGAEFGSRALAASSEDTTRYYLSLGYRYDF